MWLFYRCIVKMSIKPATRKEGVRRYHKWIIETAIVIEPEKRKTGLKWK